MKCPVCNSDMKVIYVSSDGKAEFYQCPHCNTTKAKKLVYMVEKEVR
jgi:tRNA(Ile2) C34 agmatinyltransferase TiaS